MVLGGRWPTLLVYFLQAGKRRFSELQRDNPSVSHRILSLELRKLEGIGVVRRTAHIGYPLRVDYELTPFGVRLIPLIDAIGIWWEERQDGEPEAGNSPSASRSESADKLASIRR